MGHTTLRLPQSNHAISTPLQIAATVNLTLPFYAADTQVGRGAATLDASFTASAAIPHSFPSIEVRPPNSPQPFIWLSPKDRAAGKAKLLAAALNLAIQTGAFGSLGITEAVAYEGRDVRHPDVIATVTSSVLFSTEPTDISDHGSYREDDVRRPPGGGGRLGGGTGSWRAGGFPRAGAAHRRRRLPECPAACPSDWTMPLQSHVGLVIAAPGKKAATYRHAVSTTQVATAILRLLGLDPALLEGVRAEKTKTLPLF